MNIKNFPKTSKTHDQEELSREKFRQLVPSGKYLIREFTGRDYGTDIILELKLENTATNYHNFIQLKSVKKSTRNNDDSLSFSVPVMTINYLLNQPNSIFAIYLENEDTFIWEWIRNIYLNARKRGIDTETTDQVTITFRFNEILDESNFNEIHRKTLENELLKSNLNKETTLFFDLPNCDEKIVIDKISITSLSELKLQLKQHGYKLIYSGEISTIEAMIQNFDIGCRNDPVISLIIAHAKYISGKYFEALNWLPKSAIRKSLEDGDRIFSDYLELNIKLSLGFINFVTYSNELKNIIEREPNSLNSRQINSILLSKELLNSATLDSSMERKLLILNKIKINSTEILKFQKLPEIVRIGAEIDLWELEYYKIIKKYLSEIGKNVIIQKMTGASRPNSAIKKSADEIGYNMYRLEKKYKILKISSSSHLIVQSRIITLHAVFLMQFITLANLSSVSNLSKEDINMLKEVYRELDSLNKDLYDSMLIKDFLKSRNLQAEILILQGNRSEAMNILHKVRELADEIGQVEILANCDLILKNKSFVGNLQELYNEFIN